MQCRVNGKDVDRREEVVDQRHRTLDSETSSSHGEGLRDDIAMRRQIGVSQADEAIAGGVVPWVRSIE